MIGSEYVHMSIDQNCLGFFKFCVAHLQVKREIERDLISDMHMQNKKYSNN